MSKPSPKPSLLPSPFPQDDASPLSTDRQPSPSRVAAQPAGPDESPQHRDDDEIPYIEPEEGMLVPPPNFAPFFTVIEDAATGEHYHPSVHYIFTDDDQEILTAASMRELGFDESRLQLSADESGQRNPHDEDLDDEQSATAILPPPRPNVRERYLLIDIAPDGQTVAEAQSLSQEWQLTETTVRPAPRPTWAEEALEAGEGGLMLKVFGVELPNRGKAGSSATATREVLDAAKEEAAQDPLAALDILAGRFDKGMGNIARMVGGEQSSAQAQQQQSTEAVSRSRGASLSGVGG